MATLSKTPMQNLAQKRALNAIQAIQARKEKNKNTDENKTMPGKNGGEVVKKIPNLIIESGLLGALAFAIEKGEGFGEGFDAIRIHLQSIGDPTAKHTLDIKAWFTALAGASNEQLRMTTSEAMAYLVYLRRFVKTK